MESQSEPSGASLISRERGRQQAAEGFDHAHDDAHDSNEIARAAQAYVAHYVSRSWICAQGRAIDYSKESPHEAWPWAKRDWKPTPNPIRTLVKAGALIAAEIDRLQRKVNP